MEIEKKFLIDKLPEDIKLYPFNLIEQAYLCTSPVVRIRRENDNYYMTYKGKGLMVREEYNLPLNKKAYEHLLRKADGNIISKKRYLIPFKDKYTIELDVFDGIFKGLLLAEVEFTSENEANNFIPPAWFGKDVTYDGKYHNSYMSSIKPN